METSQVYAIFLHKCEEVSYVKQTGKSERKVIERIDEPRGAGALMDHKAIQSPSPSDNSPWRARRGEAAAYPAPPVELAGW